VTLNPWAVLDRIEEGVVALDEEFAILYLNRRAARYLGGRSETLVGQQATDVAPEFVRAELGRHCRQVRTSSRTIRLSRYDAERGRWWKIRIDPLSDGVAIQFRGVKSEWGRTSEGRRPATLSFRSADHDARARRLEAALEESEARFRSVVENLVVGIYIRYGNRLSYVNPKGAAMFGYEPAEMVDVLAITDLLVAEDKPAIERLLRRGATRARVGAARTLRGTRRDGGHVDVEVYEISTRIEGVPAFIGVAVDITERQRAAAALRVREEQLRHAQKLEAVGRLAGGIAHDFNNLLMVIQGSVNLILMTAKEEVAHRSDLEEIVRATQRAAALTSQLLAFGRRQVLRPEIVNLNLAVEHLSKMMRRVIGEDIELRTELDPQLVSVRVDPGQLEQAIVNLIVNARDAMPSGGRITLRTDHAQLTAKDAARAPYRIVPGDYVRLTVEDTGMGMPDRVLARVFEPFFTTKPPGKGSGLGLSMVYGIIKQSGGYIWAKSQQNHGTTIEIYLPAVSGEANPAGEEDPALERAIPRGAGRILLVEDEAPVRTITRRLLEHAGYDVVEASGGVEALDRFDEREGQFDLVLADVIMPQMGGRELAAHLRERDPGVRMLYMTGYADDRRVRRPDPKGDFGLIEKPFMPEALLERIQAIIGPDSLSPGTST
jgi:two-component system cell cycle sensor histidine kinase/response regulator CckA